MLEELADIEEIKARMPVTYVLHTAGHEPVDRQANDLMYLTPWRQDSNPSLACYIDDETGVLVDRWRDMARGEGGDILDMIGALSPTLDSYQARLGMARKLYVKFTTDSWVAPEPAPRTGNFDAAAYQAEQDDYLLQQPLSEGALDRWLHDRNDYLRNIPASWLRDTFRVNWVRGEMKIPFMNEAGEVVVGKYRKPGEKTMSMGGTRGLYTLFYGEHLDTDKSRPVVLCEGEPDVWSGTHSTQDYAFLGLPSGAGTRPEKMLSRLVGRRVLLAFDGDEAGREASLLWASFLEDDNCRVEIVPVPWGKDLSEVADIPGMLAQSRPFQPRMPGLMIVGGRYHSVTKNDDPGQQLADFTLTPTRVMFSLEGALSYEVTDGRRAMLLTAGDLASKNAFHRWAHDRGLNWSGSDRDTTILSSTLSVDSMFVASETAADLVGLHEGHVVWQSGSIGDRPVRYVPGAVKVNLDIRLSEGDFNPKTIHAMRGLNEHRITDPILAWAAASMVRSLLPQFPILNVAGSSGSGKTTTTQAIIPTLTGSHVFQTLSSSTPYAVESIIHSSNGFPVVFDEYRPGARSQTLERLEQLARDAYDGTPSLKSAGGDSWNKIAEIRTMAPIVIAGEQSITETSHLERMILVHVTRPEVRDPAHLRALQYVRTQTDSGLSHAFMRYVVASLHADATLTYPPVGPDSLPDRVRNNLGVLDLGWRILNGFLASKGVDQLSDPDWSGIIETTAEAVATNPTVEALEWALGDRFASEDVWVDKTGDLCINAAGFVASVNKAGVFTLPGNNAKTISDLLQSDYGAVQATRQSPNGATRKRVWVLPYVSVFPDGVQ